MGLYEIENTDNPSICNIAINRQINKKHKGVRRDTPGMNFEGQAEKISTIRQIDIVCNDKKLFKRDYKLKIKI